MQYQVFVQSNPENKFIASVVGIPNCSVEGSTKEEAIELARVCLENQLANGDLVTIEVNKVPKQLENDPLIKNIGSRINYSRLVNLNNDITLSTL